MNTKLKTVLIIKLGYCETLANEVGFTPSLGDVFRHTVLLHHYKDYRVTWLTSDSALPLLTGNPYIHELLAYDPLQTPSELASRSFDEVLCLEKASSICELAKSIKTERHLGFGWNGKNVHAHPLSETALRIANGHGAGAPIQAVLYQMIGASWNKEGYVLGYKPATQPVIDIGLNYLVGSKWPTKAWPMEYWKRLESLLVRNGYSVSWQRGSSNLTEYMDWVGSLRMIITCDSLGMHLGIALERKVIALFGPTPSDQIYLYDRGVILRSDLPCPRSPCMKDKCALARPCMEYIYPESVFQSAVNLLGEGFGKLRMQRSVLAQSRRQPICKP